MEDVGMMSIRLLCLKEQIKYTRWKYIFNIVIFIVNKYMNRLSNH